MRIPAESAHPYRSRRIGEPATATFANNRIRLKVRPGTYRIACVVPSTALPTNHVYFVVGADDFARYFGAVPAVATCLAEPLPVCGMSQPAGGGIVIMTHSFVEVDVLDQQVIWFWSSRGTEVVKYVQVAEINDYERVDTEGGKR